MASLLGGQDNDDDSVRISKYFKEHDLEEFLVKMLMDLGKAAPADPLTFMQEHIDAHMGESMHKRKSGASIRSSNDEEESEEDEEDDEVADLPNIRRGSRRPPGESTKSQVMRRLTVQMSNESDAMHSFVNEWADEFSQINDAIQDKASESMKSIKANQMRMSTVFRGNNINDKKLAELMSWDFDILDTKIEQLIVHAFTIFDTWCTSDATPTETPAANPDMTGVEDNVLKSLAINKKKMKNFIGATHSNYHNDNPYHNFKHAYSVLTAVGIFLQNGVDAYCTQVDTLALLMASLTHDIGHPGMNNDFFVKKKHELAIRYNDAAVLENMHAALTFEILRMPENNFLCGWNQKDEQYRQFRKHAVAVILATDMKIHFELTSQLQGLKNKELDANSAQEKDLILSSTVHAADLSNPVLPTKIYWCWAYRVVLEFHKQANEEKRLGLPYAPFMEPHPDNEMELAKLQIGFIQFVVEPFWGTFGALFPRLYDRVEMLKLNLEIWKTKKAELDKIKEQKDAEEQAALENA